MGEHEYLFRVKGNPYVSFYSVCERKYQEISLKRQSGKGSGELFLDTNGSKLLCKQQESINWSEAVFRDINPHDG